MTKKFILVIESDLSKRDELMTLLRKYNFLAVGFTDLPPLEDKDPTVLADLILISTNAPAYEIYGKLRRHKYYKAVPCILLTEKSNRKSIIKAQNIGMVDYLARPFDAEEFTSVLKSHLN